MSELDFYIRKLQELEPRGEWKEVFSQSFDKAYQKIHESVFLRRNFYVGELQKAADTLLDLPFTLNDDERLIFRKNQKHISDILYLVKSENKRIFIVHGANTAYADKVEAMLGRLKLDFHSIPYQSEEETNIIKFAEIAKSCDYAIIALSADDAARSLNTEGEVSNRVSQNVWFQFGYFLSQLGRKNICIVESEIVIELPINIDNIDIEKVKILSNNAWKKQLLSVLSKNGIYIDDELSERLIN